MNNNFNLVEILKDCPEGTKLYSPLYGDVYFQKVEFSTSEPLISVKNQIGATRQFFSNGKYLSGFEESECLLFPSKENRDWSTFKVPVKRMKITEFKPFDKVLCRLTSVGRWHCDFFSERCYPVSGKPFIYTVGKSGYYHQCIPYNEETAHLIGSAEDCPEYYKWWEE